MVLAKRETHHVQDVSHGEDEDGSHRPGVPSPASVVNPGGKTHKLSGKDLTKTRKERTVANRIEGPSTRGNAGPPGKAQRTFLSFHLLTLIMT